MEEGKEGWEEPVVTAPSHRILANHGGSIVAENRAGSGAAFTLTLPLRPPGHWS